MADFTGSIYQDRRIASETNPFCVLGECNYSCPAMLLYHKLKLLLVLHMCTSTSTMVHILASLVEVEIQKSLIDNEILELVLSHESGSYIVVVEAYVLGLTILTEEKIGVQTLKVLSPCNISLGYYKKISLPTLVLDNFM